MSAKTWSYTNSKWGDVLTKFNNDNISTDAIGNPKIIGSNVLTWKGRQLQSIGTQSNPQKNTYQYDMEGRRISKITDGVKTEYYYNGNILAGQKNGSDTIIFLYDEKGDPFGFKYNNVEYAYIKNLQNDIIAIADKSGTILVNYSYDAWGKLIKTEGTHASTLGKINPIRYRSYYYDTESGYYFLQSRYYDPDMCRFLNADSQLNADSLLGYNMFAYCENNPIMFSDHTGQSITVATFILGCIVVTGIIDICSGDAKRRADAVLEDPSLYNIANWATMGRADIVKGAVAPENPLSFEHWMASLATGLMLIPAIDGIDNIARGVGSFLKPKIPKVQKIEIQKVGRLKPAGKSGNGYWGVKYSIPKSNGNPTVHSFELHSPHSSGPHTMWHWQRNVWNPQTNRISSGKARHWTIFGRSLD